MTLGDAVPTVNGYSVRVGGVVERDLRNGGQNAGKKGEADVRCLIERVATGYVQLTVDPRSEVAVFGTTLTGQSMDLAMQCNATMWQVK